jgi:hypothetical protein
MMRMDWMNDCKTSHWGVHCLQQIIGEVDLPKAIEITKGNIDLGHFWYTSFWVAPHLLFSNTSLPMAIRVPPSGYRFAGGNPEFDGCPSVVVGFCL